MLKIENFSKKYYKNPNYSAENINIHVKTGEVFGLVGSNGAGKSTIIKSLIGVLPFSEGTITVNGYDIAKEPEKAKKFIGYVPDDHSVYDKLTGREYVNYIGSLYGATKEQKQTALEKTAKVFDISQVLDIQIANYSHGMKQKICILGALVHSPKLWVLDEPMVGLDPQTMYTLCKYIRDYANAGNSVLFSSHNLDTVKKTCDRVAVIKKGKLIKTVDLKEEPDFDLDKFFMEVNGVDIE